MVASLVLAAAVSVSVASQSPDAAPVRKALGTANYPWYDAASDSARPVWPPQERDWDWLDRWLRGRRIPGGASLGADAGRLVAFTLAMLALAVLLGVLVVLWRQYQPEGQGWLATARGPGRAARIEGLPAGLDPAVDDPWNEVLRCRARGDYARAVVYLFVHQIVTLDRLRQVRLVPGQTGRQLVRSIGDPQFRGWVQATLRLFESVYYGHRGATAQAFEPVWVAAEAFERRVAEGVAR
jgi:hypothetical protein